MGRTKKKKQTVNFKNMKISNFLNQLNTEGTKNNNLNIKNENDKKKTTFLRSK